MSFYQTPCQKLYLATEVMAKAAAELAHPPVKQQRAGDAFCLLTAQETENASNFSISRAG